MLTFVPDDRGPQIIHACCTRWYKAQVKSMLADASIYEECTYGWFQARKQMEAEMVHRGFISQGGRPYLYNMFKQRNESGGLSAVYAKTRLVKMMIHKLAS